MASRCQAWRIPPYRPIYSLARIPAIVSGGSRPTFRYVDFGSMAVVHANAVADLHGFKFSGRQGLLLWAIVHLALIPNRENRITLSIKWLYALATRQLGLDTAKRNA